jgi:hypothetical protein
MRGGHRDRTIGLAAFAALLMIILFAQVPEIRGPLLGAGILMGLVYVLAGVVSEAGPSPSLRSSRFERALQVPARSRHRPDDLEHFERTLGWKAYSPQDFRVRVRPVLRRLLVNRLLARRGIDLDRNPQAARRRLDPELWALVGSTEMESAVVEGSVDTIYIERLVAKIERLR